MKNANNATLYTASEPHFLIVSERAAILEIVTRKNKFFCQKSALSTKALRITGMYFIRIGFCSIHCSCGHEMFSNLKSKVD